MNWLPTSEQNPPVGTVVWLYDAVKKLGPYIGHRAPDSGCLVWLRDWVLKSWDDNEHGWKRNDANMDEASPTHWQPLPPTSASDTRAAEVVAYAWKLMSPAEGRPQTRREWAHMSTCGLVPPDDRPEEVKVRELIREGKLLNNPIGDRKMTMPVKLTSASQPEAPQSGGVREQRTEAFPPCIIIGWPTIARLAHGHTVKFDNAILIPDDLLFNTAAKVLRGDFGGCECAEPREVMVNGHRCGTCGEMVRPSEVKAGAAAEPTSATDRARLPGGFRVGGRCYFTHPEKRGLLSSRVIGEIKDYDPTTGIVSIEHAGRVFQVKHTREFGGISGAPDRCKKCGRDWNQSTDARQTSEVGESHAETPTLP